MPTFQILIVATLAFDFLLLAVLAWAFHTERMRPYRIPGFAPMKVTTRERVTNMALIGTLSLGATLGLIALLMDRAIVEGEERVWVIAFQAVAILAVYDFAYYWLHRTMHIKKLMRFVHGVHHRARFPTALESLFQHPLELLAGLGLLMVCTWLVGPVHPYAFAAAFFVYSTLNIVIHSGLDFPIGLLEPINILTRKHHRHHSAEFGKNYASLTPLPDILFRTAA